MSAGSGSADGAALQPGYGGPHGIASFRDIVDLDGLGHLTEPHRLRWGLPMHSHPPPPLYAAAALPPRVVADHTRRMLAPGAEFYAVPGHELGSFGLLRQNGRVFVDDRVQPQGFNREIKPDRMPPNWVHGLLRPDAEIIDCDGPVGVALNPHMVWGHFLLEMMARIHLLARLRTLGHPIRMALPLDAPAWAQAFVALFFAADETLPYHAARQRVRAPCFVLPGMMMADYSLHPELNAVVQDVLTRAAGPQPAPPRRLYLSRSRHAGWHAVANETEVEATLSDLGFTILHPHELPLREQIAAYATATCIVAPFSSAAHNAIFAPPGTPVMCLGWMNRCQSGIAALRNQPLAYLRPADCDVIFPPANRPPGVFRFRVDCRQLARDVPAFLRFAADHRATPQPPPRITAELLAQAPWRYGRDGENPSTDALRFLPDGRIGGYDFPNERRWTLIDGVLSILNDHGLPTVRFERTERAGGRIVLRAPFLPDPRHGIVLRLERDAT